MKKLRDEVSLDMELDIAGTEYMADYFCPKSALYQYFECNPVEFGDDIQYIFNTQHGVATLYQNREDNKSQWHIGAGNVEACEELINYLDNNIDVPADEKLKQQIECLDNIDLEKMINIFHDANKYREREFLLKEIGDGLGLEEIQTILKKELQKRKLDIL